MKNITIGEKAPFEVNAVIEISKNSNMFFDIDEKSGYLRVDRFLHSSIRFPFSYGSIPETLGGDGDPLDIMIICEEEIPSRTIIKVRPIGYLEMEDESGIDSKIMAVPTDQISLEYSQVQDINDIPKGTLDKIKYFYDHYKELEIKKWTKTGKFLGKDQAYEVIRKSLKK